VPSLESFSKDQDSEACLQWMRNESVLREETLKFPKRGAGAQSVHLLNVHRYVVFCRTCRFLFFVQARCFLRASLSEVVCICVYLNDVHVFCFLVSCVGKLRGLS
jgi:hypothetical protein